MRKAAPILFSLVLALPLFGAMPTVRRLPSDPERLPRLLNQLKTMQKAARLAQCPGAQAVTGSRTARTIVFPAAGSVRGAGGEFFRSDVSLMNNGDFETSFVVFWLGRGASGEPPAFTIEGLRAGDLPTTFVDFVGEYLKLPNSLGALWIFPMDAFGDEIDPEGSIDGFSRIWTNQPGGTGTVSQQFEAVDPFSFEFYYDTIAIGLQHNAQYRTSWGIVNLDEIPHTYRVYATSNPVPGPTDEHVTIPAFSMSQVGLSRDIDYGDEGMVVLMNIADDFEDDVPPFVAFASSTDNRTGDGWVVLASAQWEPADFPEE